MNLLTKLFGSYSKKELKRIEPLKQAVLALDDKYTKMTDEELKGQTAVLKERLSLGSSLDDILPEAFATCREAMWRVLSIKPFPVQIIGGIILHQGRIAEMKTGEGKTFTAALPAYLNALSGKGVHIVTVNDYLAKYQGEMMARVFNYLGLTVGLAIPGMEPDEKKKAYMGRDERGRMAYCEFKENLVGKFADVEITSTGGMSLIGKVIKIND